MRITSYVGDKKRRRRAKRQAGGYNLLAQRGVEGVNRAIRGIISRAFGFPNFDNLRLQILVEYGNM